MNSYNQEQKPGGEHRHGDVALVLPLSKLDRTLLSVVGGKAANLGELIRAGFTVPEGFCITTAAYERVSESAGLEAILVELNTSRAEDPAHLAELAAAARTALLHAPVPTSVAVAISEAYHALFHGEPVPVAVRSSATAEDLPSGSFAGQQETYLNIVGIDAVLDAVRRCWASLWTDRAVSYRASLGLDPRSVRLAVVVQRMIDAEVAGVLFTANPLTDKRRQAVIDANPGLGEAVVSGATNPDHFVVNTTTGEIVERRPGDKQVIIRATAGGGTLRVEQAGARAEACLSDAQVRALAALGAQVEAYYGTLRGEVFQERSQRGGGGRKAPARGPTSTPSHPCLYRHRKALQNTSLGKGYGEPQDIEWAMDAFGHFWLTQARPITTLFPLPPEALSTDEDLRVYLSFNVQQGTYLPSTPMGRSAVRLLASSVLTYIGFSPRDRMQGPRFLTEAASRIFVDVTAALRNSVGRKLLLRSMEEAEIHAAAVFHQLATDPRFSLVPAPRWPFFRASVSLLVRTRLPWYLVQALLVPRTGRERLKRLERTLRDESKFEAPTDPADCLAAAEQILFDSTVRMLNSTSSAMVTSMLAYTLASTLLGDLASEGELQGVLRGLPSNPTTEMNLVLWALAQQVHADPATARLVRDTPPARLADDYRNGNLPPLLQDGLAYFLATYGHRSVAELDLGAPRWSEDPTYVLGILASYLQLHDLALSPDAQYRRAAEEAEAMVAELKHRARRKSWLRGLLAGFFLDRARALGGLREMPRFLLTLLLARARMLLWPVGEKLARAGQLEKAEDIFYITLPEAHAALAGADLRSIVSERRAIFEQELARRHVPLVLLSDGTEPSVETGMAASAQATLQGTPASPGVVTAPARVILDPYGAHLEPGEVLVAPSTDPGWTPLFLTAGGLVMETGGSMSHGVIVAREYGIPAVVGVPGVTERIITGQQITVDGTVGTIVIEPAE
jgi:rifampicin phosphotransferase